jgi:hypothetical protein
MTNRRDFIKQISAAGIISTVPDSLFPGMKPANDKIWASLLHLSFNMWEEYVSPHRPFRGYDPNLRLSGSLWNDALARMESERMNMVVIDLGNAVRYDSHPEIAVNNAWTTSQLQKELKRIRKMGLEPIPKLNFSTGHDTWLGEYSRMVSTEKYYKVCTDLISEVCSLFDKPRFFHLGMDEENASHQSHYKYIVVRQDEVWWKDFYFLVDQVEKQNSRAWIWPDYMLWNFPDQFFEKMPKTVIQSNWYYGESFDANDKYVKAYLDLESHGYDQIPTGSYHAENERSFMNTVQFCEKNIDDKRLLGFLQTFWKPTIEEFRERILKGVELAGEAKSWFEENHK